MFVWRRKMVALKALQRTALTMLCCGLLACSGQQDFSDLEATMEAIKKRPPGRIQPPPKLEVFENYVYSASLLRSPFQPPVIAAPVRVPMQGKKVFPDMDRPKEALEDFSIETLAMVGTIRREDQSLNALIQDGKSGIQRVRIGNFMGKNHGKIINITHQQIDLIELIPDGSDGWVERPRTVVMSSED